MTEISSLSTVTRAKIWIYRQVNKSRSLNYCLDSFGNFARCIVPSYTPGRSRTSYRLFDAVTKPTVIKIDENGFSQDGTNLSKNTFLAQSFLEKGFLGLRLNPGFTPADLINMSKAGQPLHADKASLLPDPEQAARLLGAVKDKNLMTQLRTFGFAGIFASVSYVLYRSVTFGFLHGTPLDYIFSALLLASNAFDSFIILKNQDHLISGQKYVPLSGSAETKSRVAGQNGPLASILVPALNEPLEVMARTLLAAGRQSYVNKEVVLLLDDPPGSPSIRDVHAMVEQVNAALTAEGLQPCVKIFERKKYANIVNQAKNKADNINAFLVYARGKQLVEALGSEGQSLVMTEAEFVEQAGRCQATRKLSFTAGEHYVIIDADYKLVPHFLTDTVAILEENPETAMVQTPQNLIPEKGSPVEKYSSLAINGSWQFMRRGNARDGSLFWGGTNCTVRWSALESIKTEAEGRTEYLTTKNITEDLYCSLLLIQRGWKFSFIPTPMAEGMPISNLSDHFSTFWRYVEGTTEATLDLTIPHMVRNPKFAFSKAGIEFLSHGIQGFMGYPVVFFSLVPALSLLGVNFPLQSTTPFLTLFIAQLWLNSRSARLIAKHQGGRPLDHLKSGLLFYLHAPTYIHATLSAFWNKLTGRRATFLRTPKSGQRSVVPLKYLLPLMAIPTLNYASFGIDLAQYLGGESGALQGSLWSVFQAFVFTYGLLYFNGVKNTWQDLKIGIKNLFARKAGTGA